jgi:hypothetical protein
MSFFSTFRRSGKQYVAESTDKPQHDDDPAKENAPALATTLEVGDLQGSIDVKVGNLRVLVDFNNIGLMFKCSVGSSPQQAVVIAAVMIFISLATCYMQMNQKGEAMVRCDPAQIIGGMHGTHRRKCHTTSLQNATMPSAMSALSMDQTIKAGTTAPDMSKATLTRTGNMADNQVQHTAELPAQFCLSIWVESMEHTLSP